MYQSAPDLSIGSMSMSFGRENSRPRGGSRVVVGGKTPKLGQADLGASTTQSELGPGQLVIARPLALGPRRSRERATVRFVKLKSVTWLLLQVPPTCPKLTKKSDQGSSGRGVSANSEAKFCCYKIFLLQIYHVYKH